MPAPGGTVHGTLTASDIGGPSGQSISAGDFGALVRARAGSPGLMSRSIPRKLPFCVVMRMAPFRHRVGAEQAQHPHASFRSRTAHGDGGHVPFRQGMRSIQMVDGKCHAHAM